MRYKGSLMCGMIDPSLGDVGRSHWVRVAPSHRRKGGDRHAQSGLATLQRRGIQRALLTCDRDNWGSVRTIEANGGVLSREPWSPSDQRVTRWYHIELAMRDT